MWWSAVKGCLETVNWELRFASADFSEFGELQPRGIDNGCVCFVCVFVLCVSTIQDLDCHKTTSNIFIAAGCITSKKGSPTQALPPFKIPRFHVRVLLGMKPCCRNTQDVQEHASQCGQIGL